MTICVCGQTIVIGVMILDYNDFYQSERRQERDMRTESLPTYTAKTFLWMFLGLMITFGVAVGGYASGLTIYAFLSIPAFHIVVLVAELAVVIVLSARIHRLSVPSATLLFFAYAALTGVVFSTYFLIFDLASLVLVFAVTALYFGALALFGYFTKSDLTRLRPILVGGLIFLVIFGLVSLFLPVFSGLERIYCLIGIAIFLGLTAYDTQQIKENYFSFGHDSQMAQKASIYSALQLYLDFINLFLYLLRFLGKNKN